MLPVTVWALPKILLSSTEFRSSIEGYALRHSNRFTPEALRRYGRRLRHDGFRLEWLAIR